MALRDIARLLDNESLSPLGAIVRDAHRAGDLVAASFVTPIFRDHGRRDHFAAGAQELFDDDDVRRAEGNPEGRVSRFASPVAIHRTYQPAGAGGPRRAGCLASGRRRDYRDRREG